MGDERAWKAEVERLRAENSRLTILLEQHRIEWRQREPEEVAQSLTRSDVKPLTAEQRVACRRAHSMRSGSLARALLGTRVVLGRSPYQYIQFREILGWKGRIRPQRGSQFFCKINVFRTFARLVRSSKSIAHEKFANRAI